MAAEIRHREFRFPVAIAWRGGRRTTAQVGGKQALPHRHAAGVQGHRPRSVEP